MLLLSLSGVRVVWATGQHPNLPPRSPPNCLSQTQRGGPGGCGLVIGGRGLLLIVGVACGVTVPTLQAVLMNLLLRNYLHHNLYDQVRLPSHCPGATHSLSLSLRLINLFPSQNSQKVPTIMRLQGSITTSVSCLDTTTHLQPFLSISSPFISLSTVCV